LTEDEWAAITQVADWLKQFHAATTQMSTSKQPMLSSTHAIFRGLQEHIQQIYRDLPLSTVLRIKTGLLDAHQKLSDYYYKYDQSPFYTWAARKFLDSDLRILFTVMIHFPVLDPHISYEGVKEDYADDADLLKYLESAKELLHTHYTKPTEHVLLRKLLMPVFKMSLTILHLKSTSP
jgi:hypothetical protein